MIDPVAKAKRNELIVKLQGTKKYPKLKKVREKLLDINTSVELAEILDVTRPTMSKLEKCINKLSGAQYLAVCALIEKKKNEALLTLNDISLDKEKFREIVVYKLSPMSYFYGFSFMFDLFGLEKYKKNKDEDKYKNSISKLRKVTCLDNWIESLSYKEEIGENEEENILKNGDIFIDFLSFKGIEDINSFFSKYSKESSGNKGRIYYIYRDLIKLLDNLQKKIEDTRFSEDIANFIIKFSLLQKENKLEPLAYEELNGNLGFPTKESPVVFIVQDENIARKLKKDIVFNVIKLKEIDKKNQFDTFTGVFKAFVTDEIQICKYEDRKLKRWLIDYESMLEELYDLSIEEKEALNNRMLSSSKPNIYTENMEEIKPVVNEKEIAELIGKMDDYKDKYTRGKKVMNDKLEALMKQILNHISSDDTK